MDPPTDGVYGSPGLLTLYMSTALAAKLILSLAGAWTAEVGELLLMLIAVVVGVYSSAAGRLSSVVHCHVEMPTTDRREEGFYCHKHYDREE